MLNPHAVSIGAVTGDAVRRHPEGTRLWVLDRVSLVEQRLRSGTRPPTVRERTVRLELRRVGSGHRMTFGAGEDMLSQWMGEHAFVCWTAVASPGHS
jgi:hypothetical protein